MSKRANSIPESMRDELQAWNDGQGIDLESWVGCTGSFSLAVGYASILCPEFIEFEDYILLAREITNETIRTIRGFEAQEGSTPRSVERVLNHRHIADVQHVGCPDASADKLIFVGNAMKMTWAGLLAQKFPSKPCMVKFYEPADRNNLMEYQITFWQAKHT